MAARYRDRGIVRRRRRVYAGSREKNRKNRNTARTVRGHSFTAILGRRKSRRDADRAQRGLSANA